MFARLIVAFALAFGPVAGTALGQGAGGGQAGGAAQEYRLGPNDVVEVNVLGRDDFKTRARIRPDGTIVLPFLGAVPAGQQTPTELSASVAAALRAGGYFANPAVTVDVVSYTSQYVTVLGSVSNPGLVPIDRAYRLSEILARVGGTRSGSADYVVLRSANGPEQRFVIEALATGDASQDPLVSPGDKIYIPEAELFYVYGEVNSPGAFAIMSDPTLRKALARGGGIKATGSERRVKVFRQGQQLTASDLSSPVQPGDVIVVGERLF